MNRFFALKGREKQEMSADVVTSMLQVFSTSVYALLDPGCILSFVTPLLSLSFDILPEVLHDPIVVSKPLGETVRTDRVYKDCPIVLCGKTMFATWLSYQCMILILFLALTVFMFVMLVWFVVVGL